MPIIRTGARRVYQCDNCGTTDAWGDDWAWFGSYKQLDDYGLKGVEEVIVTCSALCRIKMVATNRLPHEGIDDFGKVIDDHTDDKPPSRKRLTDTTGFRKD